MTRFGRGFWLAWATVAAAGCGGDPTAGPLRDQAVIYARALAASEAGDRAGALRHFDDLVAAAPRPEYRLVRGLEHLRAGDAAKAAADAEAGLATAPEEPTRSDLKWLAAEARKLASGGTPNATAAPPSWNH